MAEQDLFPRLGRMVNVLGIFRMHWDEQLSFLGLRWPSTGCTPLPITLRFPQSPMASSTPDAGREGLQNSLVGWRRRITTIVSRDYTAGPHMEKNPLCAVDL